MLAVWRHGDEPQHAGGTVTMPWYTTADARRDAEKQRANERTCMMELLEFPDMSDGWGCSECQEEFKATKKFEKNTHCPSCGCRISVWEAEND